MREDFCGTAAFATAWVQAHRENRAIGVDLDPDPLDWGRRHNLDRLRPEQARRITLLQEDVRTARAPKVDVLVAFNFSFFLFKQRAALLDYFKRCHAAMKSDGIFVIDAYGGPESMEKRREKRRIGRFTYIWDQYRYDPITHDATCHIHFEFRDGSKIERAWTYHWRLWTIAELRELLLEAGFKSTEVYWEGTELASNEPNGIFRPRKHADEDPAWVAYLRGGEVGAALSAAARPPRTFALRSSAGLEATILDRGATLMRLRVPDAAGRLGDVVLGFDDPIGYCGPHPVSRRNRRALREPHRRRAPIAIDGRHSRSRPTKAATPCTAARAASTR